MIPRPTTTHALLLIALACIACGSARTVSPGASGDVRAPDATAAWQTLTHELPGRWSATDEAGHRVDVDFRLVSNDSALVETWGRPGHQTVTVYHRDGASLMATHYCAQGNQPRLRIASGDARHPVFRFADATGVDPGEAVLIELSYAFEDRTFDRVETYRRPDGTLERTRWHFTPQSDASGSSECGVVAKMRTNDNVRANRS